MGSIPAIHGASIFKKGLGARGRRKYCPWVCSLCVESWGLTISWGRGGGHCPISPKLGCVGVHVCVALLKSLLLVWPEVLAAVHGVLPVGAGASRTVCVHWGSQHKAQC